MYKEDGTPMWNPSAFVANIYIVIQCACTPANVHLIQNPQEFVDNIRATGGDAGGCSEEEEENQFIFPKDSFPNPSFK